MGAVSQAANGAVTIDGDGTVTYTPNAGFSGVDGFTYQAGDPSGATSGPVSVTITVESVNHAPVAESGSIVVAPGGSVEGGFAPRMWTETR